jgi:predicted dehydrogenase
VTEPRKRIGVGVVGTGFMAGAHLDALRRLPGVEIVAVSGHDPARAGEVAALHGARAYTDHRALIDDPAVEAVHTCTVNRLHHDVNLAALERGKHVMSEKPLAVDSAESARLVAAAESAAERGVQSGVCFNYRHYPMILELRERMHSGEPGAPHFVHGRYHQDWLLYETDWNWRLDEVDAGASRAVADIGSHWADLVQFVTGDAITEVFADLATLHRTRVRPSGDGQRTTFAAASAGGGERVPIESEDFGSVLVRFQSGARGTFSVSQASAGRKNGLGFEIDCAEAALAWEQERPERAWIGRRSAPSLELVRDPVALHPRAARFAHLPAGHPEGWSDALLNVFDDFYATVADPGHESAVASFREGHARVQLVEAVMASDREQRWARVGAAAEVSA